MSIKPWALPLILSSLLSLAIIILWLDSDNTEMTLALFIALISLVLCGFGFSLSFKLGFFHTKDQNK